MELIRLFYWAFRLHTRKIVVFSFVLLFINISYFFLNASIQNHKRETTKTTNKPLIVFDERFHSMPNVRLVDLESSLEQKSFYEKIVCKKSNTITLCEPEDSKKDAFEKDLFGNQKMTNYS